MFDDFDRMKKKSEAYYICFQGHLSCYFVSAYNFLSITLPISNKLKASMKNKSLHNALETNFFVFKLMLCKCKMKQLINVSEKDMFHLTTIVRIDVYFSVFGDTPTAIEI